MNFFKKLLLYRSYAKVLTTNRIDLESRFNIRVDRANRLYTVLNIPESVFGEPYNLRTNDIETISSQYVREYIRSLSTYLDSIGLSELYDFYEPVKKVEKYSFLIILGFKPFNSVKYNTILYFRIVPALTILLILALLLHIL